MQICDHHTVEHCVLVIPLVDSVIAWVRVTDKSNNFSVNSTQSTTPAHATTPAHLYSTTQSSQTFQLVDYKVTQARTVTKQPHCHYM